MKEMAKYFATETAAEKGPSVRNGIKLRTKNSVHFEGELYSRTIKRLKYVTEDAIKKRTLAFL